MFKTMADVKRANKAVGGHFFDRETVRFFNGRVEGGPYAGRYFVDSSQFIDANRGVSDPRRYHVREAHPDGRIDLVSTHVTKAEAIAAAKGAKVNPRKNSGKSVYVLTAGSRGAPRGYIGTFATKAEAEAARLRERGPAYIKREIVKRNPPTNTGVVNRRRNPRDHGTGLKPTGKGKPLVRVYDYNGAEIRKTPAGRFAVGSYGFATLKSAKAYVDGRVSGIPVRKNPPTRGSTTYKGHLTDLGHKFVEEWFQEANVPEGLGHEAMVIFTWAAANAEWNGSAWSRAIRERNPGPLYLDARVGGKPVSRGMTKIGRRDVTRALTEIQRALRKSR